MTRVVDGMYADVELDTGFFIPDNQIDLLCEWLESYAMALEKTWRNKGAVGDEKTQKFAKVRSFKIAINKAREKD